MLKPQKKKVSKKELKRDPLLDSVLKAQTFYEKNRNILTYTVIGVIAVILISFWVKAIYEETNQEAVTLLGKAQVEYDQMNYSKARDFLNALLKEYDGTEAAEQGTFLLANLNFNENKTDEAMRLFKEFTDSYSGSHILLASGYAGIAACFEAQNNYSEAAVAYEKAFNEAGDFVKAADYLYLAGLCYQKANDTDDSKKAFQKLIDEFPDSPRKYDAQTELILAAK